MNDIEHLAAIKVEEVLEFLQNAPVALDKIINHDELFELCYNSIFDDMVAAAETRAEETKLEGLLDGSDYQATH